MFYRFQASELVKEWSKLVSKRNQLSMSAEEELQYIHSLKTSLLLAINDKKLTPLSKQGFPIAVGENESTDYFIDLQDFCNWGRTTPNSSIPQDEFELAHMLGIQDLDESSTPLRIAQLLSPETQEFKEVSAQVKDSHIDRLTGNLDSVALRVTPPITVFRASKFTDLNDLADAPRRLATLRLLGGKATLSKGVWKFTKIQALFEKEKLEGRPRHSPKTIRKDLREAAFEEKRKKRDGTNLE